MEGSVLILLLQLKKENFVRALPKNGFKNKVRAMFLSLCVLASMAGDVPVFPLWQASAITLSTVGQFAQLGEKNRCFLQRQQAAQAQSSTANRLLLRHNTVVKQKHITLPVEVIMQNPQLPNGCEITSATIVLRFLGFPAEKTEMADVYLPKQYPWYRANPNEAYMGNPYGAGWYCYAKPLAQAINAYLAAQGEKEIKAEDITGTDFPALKRYLQEDTPVIFWGTIAFEFPRRAAGVILPTGEAPYTNLHCLVLNGYDEIWAYITDPLGITEKVSLQRFEYIYGLMGKRAVVLQG